jgi:hypothetical protein
MEINTIKLILLITLVIIIFCLILCNSYTFRKHLLSSKVETPKENFNIFGLPDFDTFEDGVMKKVDLYTEKTNLGTTLTNSSKDEIEPVKWWYKLEEAFDNRDLSGQLKSYIYSFCPNLQTLPSTSYYGLTQDSVYIMNSLKNKFEREHITPEMIVDKDSVNKYFDVCRTELTKSSNSYELNLNMLYNDGKVQNSIWSNVI